MRWLGGLFLLPLALATGCEDGVAPTHRQIFVEVPPDSVLAPAAPDDDRDPETPLVDDDGEPLPPAVDDGGTYINMEGPQFSTRAASVKPRSLFSPCRTLSPSSRKV